MIYYFKIPALLILLFYCLQDNNNKTKDIEHIVIVNHPSEKNPITATLIQKIDREGLTIGYTMEVESVICLEEVCKVIPVILYWNNVGIFKTYELQKNATLEKWEADIFEEEDYVKLQSILRNPDSPFKDVYIHEILAIPSDSNEDVDAISGATILMLDDEDTVRGATLTCYTLWHWANGEITEIIKDFTKRNISKTQIHSLLTQDNAHYFLALQALEYQNIYTDTIIQSLKEKILIEDNKNLLKPTLKYFETMDSEVYFKNLLDVFIKGQKNQKLTVIQSLKTTDKKIPETFLERLSDVLTQLQSFQEVNTFLDFLQENNTASKKIINNTFSLLDSHFLIARRAYWFLKNQQLTASQKEKLNAFYNHNKNRL